MSETVGEEAMEKKISKLCRINVECRAMSLPITDF
jgi:hypothetical protein